MKPGSSVELIGEISGERLAEFLLGARAFVFPGEEDFGIAPVEAQACGVPIIAYGRGGALETVVGLDDREGRDPTGVFFQEQTVESLLAGVEAFEKVERSLSPAAARAQALRFDRPRFKDALRRSLGKEFGMVLGRAEAGRPGSAADAGRDRSTAV